ncbi:MAG: SDR family oxidoreductase [Saprospiraceae bacterium]
MKIGITGATGKLGTWVLAKLKERVAGDEIVALVRNPEKLEDKSIEARNFDYNQPNALAASLQGIDKLLLISGNEIGKRFEQHQAVIQAAKEAGVNQMVYTSLLNADDSSLVLAPEHLETEKALKASGIDYTILRNGWYNENYTESVQGVLEAGNLFGSAGEGKISSASREDFAEAAAVVLAEGTHKNKTYELSGDQEFTMQDYANEISEISGTKIPYVDLSEGEYSNALVESGLPEGLAGFLAGTHTATRKGDLYDAGNDLHNLIGRPTTSIRQSLSNELKG